MATNNPAFIQEVLRLTNEFRAQYGLPALTLNDELTTAAQLHTEDMANTDNMSHTGSDGSDVLMRVQEAGYQPLSTWGENVAEGYLTPQEVVNGWINSPGHRENMLNPDFTEIGIGYINQTNAIDADGYADYWTQVFSNGDTNPGSTPTAPGNSPDVLIGTDGADTLVGTAANNYIVGKGSSDTLTGGAGADMFIFTSSTQGLDIITDFNASEGDKIVFVGQEFFNSLGMTDASFDFSSMILSIGSAQMAQLVGSNGYSWASGTDFASAGLPNIAV